MGGWSDARWVHDARLVPGPPPQDFSAPALDRVAAAAVLYDKLREILAAIHNVKLAPAL